MFACRINGAASVAMINMCRSLCGIIVVVKLACGVVVVIAVVVAPGVTSHRTVGLSVLGVSYCDDEVAVDGVTPSRWKAMNCSTTSASVQVFSRSARWLHL